MSSDFQKARRHFLAAQQCLCRAASEELPRIREIVRAVAKIGARINAGGE